MQTQPIQPFSKLHLELAMIDAHKAGFMHLFAALKTLYVRLHGGK